VRSCVPSQAQGGEVIECRAQRLGDQFQQVRIVHRGQHMGTVGALLAVRLYQAACLEAFEHCVQQEGFRLASQEACTEFGQDAEVEPGIRQLESEGILPVDPSAHGIGGLAVAEMLKELQHRDQRQSPWRQGRLTPGWMETAEILVCVKGTELVA